MWAGDAALCYASGRTVYANVRRDIDQRGNRKMMKRRQRILSCMLIAAPILGLASYGAPRTNAASIAQSGVTTITFMNDGGVQGDTQFRVMIDAFNKSHPTIQVKDELVPNTITKFLTASTSGQAPDVLWWDRVQTALYAPKGLLYPINGFMKQDGVSQSQFYQQALKELSWNGNLYGLPATVDCRDLFYNKKLLAQAGLKPPTTWSELEQDARKLTLWNGNKLIRAGFSIADPGLFNMYLQQAGGRMVSADGSHTTFDSAAGMAVLNFWNRLINKDKVYQVGFDQGLGQNVDGFAIGKDAMIYSGPWQISTYKKLGIDYGIVQPPAGPSGLKASIMGGLGLAIPAASQHKQAAWTFIKWWMADPKNALSWGKESDSITGNLKANQDAFYQKDPFWRPILDTLTYAKVRPTFAGYATMEAQALVPNLQLFLEGKQSAAQALSAATTQGNQVLQRDNSPQ